MSGGIVLVLVIVLWLFVLAPLWLRGQKPIRKAGRAFEETRVVYEGGSQPVRQPSRRPRLVPRGVEYPDARDDADGYELVDAEDVLIDERTETPATELAGTVVDGDVVLELEEAPQGRDVEGARGAGDADGVGDVASAGAADAAEGADATEVRAQDDDAAEAVRPSASATAVTARVGDADDEQDRFELDESFTSPEDLLYPDTRAPRRHRGMRVIEGVADEHDGGSAADVDDTGDAVAATSFASARDEDVAGVAEGADEVASAVQRDHEELEDRAAGAPRRWAAEGGLARRVGQSPEAELTEEEREFAASRRGRGGWDPDADERHSLSRYQRRQRTLIGLAVAIVLSGFFGFVFGGWAWAPFIVALVLGVLYLVALRSQVRQEEALRARRVKQLRRARLGVRNRDDEELQIPRALRRPGAVVIELDDESPDFVHMPEMESPFGGDTGGDGPHSRSKNGADDYPTLRVS